MGTLRNHAEIVNFKSNAITISIIRWPLIRRFSLWLLRSVGLIKRHTMPTSFVPAYEVAVYDCDADLIARAKPEILFFFRNKAITQEKLPELKSCIERGGTLGVYVQDFIQSSDPRNVGMIVSKGSADIYKELSGK